MGHVDGAPGVLDLEMDKTIESWRDWGRGRERENVREEGAFSEGNGSGQEGVLGTLHLWETVVNWL